MNGIINNFINDQNNHNRNYYYQRYTSNRQVSNKAQKFSCDCTGRKYKNGVKGCKMHQYYCDYGEGILVSKHDRNWKQYRKTQYWKIKYF